jgi:hypothetical protein
LCSSSSSASEWKEEGSQTMANIIEMTGHELHFERTVQMCRRMQSSCKRLPVVESKGGECEEVGGVEMDRGGEFQMTVALSPSSLIDNKILSHLDID